MKHHQVKYMLELANKPSLDEHETANLQALILAYRAFVMKTVNEVAANL